MAAIRDWVIRANENRRSRLHDYEDRHLPLRGVADIPIVVWQALGRRFLGRRPVLPWIAYPAIRWIEHIIEGDWRVLEMGSGNSTLWLAQRVQAIRSVESDNDWYGRVAAGLVDARATVDYQLVDVDRCPEAYWTVSQEEVGSYDFILVDGLFRERCMESALRAVRPGGYIYLDNIDTERPAFVILREAIRTWGGAIELFTGFPPAQPTVTTGALARLKAP